MLTFLTGCAALSSMSGEPDTGTGADSAPPADTSSGTDDDSADSADSTDTDHSDDDADADGYTSAVDCDDTRAHVHPGADERCDGLDDDCDETTGEAGLALWTHADGSEDDVTDDLLGPAGSPWVVDDGTLRLCEGTWPVRLEFYGESTLLGAGETKTILDAKGEGPTLFVHPGATVALADFTATNGAAEPVLDWNGWSWRTGGNLLCMEARVVVDRVTLHQGTADFGGNVALRRCTSAFDDVNVTLGGATYDGAGIWLEEGDVAFANGLISSGYSANGAGISIWSGSVVLDHTLVEGNYADFGGGVELLAESALTCIGDASSSAGFLRNRSSYTGPAIKAWAPTSVTATQCDFGEGPDDNLGTGGELVVVPAAGGPNFEADYGNDADLVCIGDSCS